MASPTLPVDHQPDSSRSPGEAGAAVLPLVPMVSVIIPVKDGGELLQTCVQALLDQDYPRDRYEVLVVDNGSAVSPKATLPTDRRVTVLADPVPGSYHARNTALAVAKGDILAFTDGDCLPAPDWISAVARHLVEHPELAMIGGRVELRYAAGEPVTGPEWCEFLEGFPQERYLQSGFAVTANMATRRSVMDQVGRFDADLKSGGDAEWGRRVRAAGGAQAYLATAVVQHPARDTWVELRTKTVRTTRGVADRTFKSATSPASARKILVRAVAGRLARMAVRPFQVLREARLPSTAAKARCLGTTWRVDAAVLSVLVPAVLRGR